jgi:hypothetical protein
MIILYPNINCIRLCPSDKNSIAMTNDQDRVTRIRKGSKPGDQIRVGRNDRSRESEDYDDYDANERHENHMSTENQYSVAATS